MFSRNKNANPQILVRIRQDPVDTVVKRRIKKSSDGLKTYVEMEKQTKDKAGWTLDVTGCIRPTQKGLAVDCFYGANHAIRYDVRGNKDEVLKVSNDMSKDEIQHFANMQIFKAHYSKVLSDLISALKPYLIVLTITVVISIAIGGYNAYAISKIPSIGVPLPPSPTPPPVVVG